MHTLFLHSFTQTPAPASGLVIPHKVRVGGVQHNIRQIHLPRNMVAPGQIPYFGVLGRLSTIEGTVCWIIMRLPNYTMTLKYSITYITIHYGTITFIFSNNRSFKLPNHTATPVHPKMIWIF